MSEPYHIIYRNEVLDDFKQIPRNIQERIIRAIEDRLQTESTRYGTRLRRSLLGLWKIRVGDYRVIYEVMDIETAAKQSPKKVRVWVAGHRKKAYEEALKRWR